MKHVATIFLLSAMLAAPAAAQPAVHGTRESFHLDLEVDPTAYVFGGYSGHVGLGWKQLRLDLGVYAMDLPELLHGNEGWDASFDGAGAKLQWFPFAEQRGAFVDVAGGATRQRVTLRETGASRRDTVFGVGMDAGWRFLLPNRFYATLWGGIAYGLNSEDVMLDGKTFTKSHFVPFAAVHLGYRFR
jgi:hypothetical protein